MEKWETLAEKCIVEAKSVCLSEILVNLSKTIFSILWLIFAHFSSHFQ